MEQVSTLERQTMFSIFPETILRESLRKLIVEVVRCFWAKQNPIFLICCFLIFVWSRPIFYRAPYWTPVQGPRWSYFCWTPAKRNLAFHDSICPCFVTGPLAILCRSDGLCFLRGYVRQWWQPQEKGHLKPISWVGVFRADDGLDSGNLPTLPTAFPFSFKKAYSYCFIVLIVSHRFVEVCLCFYKYVQVFIHTTIK